jgi:hypothetical protein
VKNFEGADSRYSQTVMLTLRSCPGMKNMPMASIPIYILYQGMVLSGYALPVQDIVISNYPPLQIFIQGWNLGTLSYANQKWSMDKPIDSKFIEALGNYVEGYMQSHKETA